MFFNVWEIFWVPNIDAGLNILKQDVCWKVLYHIWYYGPLPGKITEKGFLLNSIPGTLLKYSIAYSFCSLCFYVCREEILIVMILLS